MKTNQSTKSIKGISKAICLMLAMMIASLRSSAQDTAYIRSDAILDGNPYIACLSMACLPLYTTTHGLTGSKVVYDYKWYGVQGGLLYSAPTGDSTFVLCSPVIDTVYCVVTDAIGTHDTTVHVYVDAEEQPYFYNILPIYDTVTVGTYSSLTVPFLASSPTWINGLDMSGNTSWMFDPFVISSDGLSEVTINIFSPALSDSGVYSITIGNRACPAQSTDLHLTVLDTSSAGPDQVTCQYGYVNMMATGTGIWSALPSNPASPTILTPSSPTTAVEHFTSTGHYGFVWGGDTMFVEVYFSPDSIYTTAMHTTICAGMVDTFILSYHNIVPYTPAYQWYKNSQSNPILGATDSIYYTSDIADGDYIWAEVTNSPGCDIPYSVVHTITVINCTGPAGPDQSLCQYHYTNMNADGTGTWTTLPGNPALTVFADISFPSSGITGFDQPGTYGYIWTTGSGPDTMFIYVTAKPYAGADQNVVLNGTATMAATGTGVWSTAGHSSSTTIISPTSPTTAITGFTSLIGYIYVWTSNGCDDTVLVYVVPDSVISAGPDQTVCQYSGATMTATGAGAWSALATNPSVTTIADPADPHTIITGFADAGAYSFVWTGVSSADTVVIHITAKPDAGVDQSVCTLTDVVQLAGVGSGVWSQYFDPDNDPQASTIVDIHSATTTVTHNTVMGNYGYIWTVNGCTDTMWLVVGGGYIIDTLLRTRSICQNGTATLIATTEYYTVHHWLPSTGNPGTVIIAHPDSAVTTVSGFSTPGVYKFVMKEGDCEDTVFVLVTAKPDAGTDQTISAAAFPGGLATMSSSGTGTWTSGVGNPGTATITTPAATNTTITGFSAPGVYYFIWTNGAGCSDTAAVQVNASIASADSVWPGDADHNGLADNDDPLYIGIAYGLNGPARSDQSIVWSAHYAQDWGMQFLNGANGKHADCDGNGMINADDTTAIVQNFGLTHSKTNSSAPWRSGIPALKAVLSADTVSDGDTLDVSFDLGDASIQAENVYGIAFTYNFDPAVVDSAYTGITTGSSWLGSSADKISISKKLHAAGQIKTAITRIDHFTRSGNGVIAMARFKITTDNISGKDLAYYSNIGFISDVLAVDSSGRQIQVNEGADTNQVAFAPTGIKEINSEKVYLYPNPAKDKVTVSATSLISEVTVVDVTGQEVYHHVKCNANTLNIDISLLENGVYFVQIRSSKGAGVAKLSVLR